MPKQQAGEIFGIGLSKTGTTSLYAALGILGFRSGTYRHMKALGLEDWFKGDFSTDYLGDYDAVTDLPIGSFYPQLFHRYPGSKFVLTVREKNAWMKSCQPWHGQLPDADDEFARSTRLATYGSEAYNAVRFEFVYQAHMTNVKWFFRKNLNSILVLDVIGGQGWEALCPFLGLNEPEVEFPNVLPGYIGPGEDP